MTSTPAEVLRTTCATCGAQISYAPGTTSLRCTACGAVQAIAPVDRPIVEHSYDEWADRAAKPVATVGKRVLQCQVCGATTETDQLSATCRFCKGALVALDDPGDVIAPEVVVPFRVGSDGAVEAFRTWVRSRRFAPNALKRVGRTDSLQGTYLPHWTYDAHSETDYQGRRGEHYWVTETYTVSDGQGGTRTETRQVQHTNWYSADGHVVHDFDDVLVPATTRLSDDDLDKMGPWQLGDGVAFQPEYLTGYAALRYDIDPDAGLQKAQGRMEDAIRDDCRADIGGDEQQVLSMDIRYTATMFKLVLLPLWIASYLYAGKTFQVLVNANTGEVVGQRPYSKSKIAAAVLLGLVVVAALVLLWVSRRR